MQVPLGNREYFKNELPTGETDRTPFRGAIMLTQLCQLERAHKCISAIQTTLLVEKEFDVRAATTCKQNGPTAMVPYFGSLDLSTYERAAMKNAE
jgi:hypothetical protein